VQVQEEQVQVQVQEEQTQEQMHGRSDPARTTRAGAGTVDKRTWYPTAQARCTWSSTRRTDLSRTPPSRGGWLRTRWGRRSPSLWGWRGA
jgi:hypothetical protein